MLTKLLRVFFLKNRILPRKYGLKGLQWVNMTTTRGGAPDSGYKTIRHIWAEIKKLLDIESSYLATPKSKLHLMKFLPKSQDELAARTMKDSFDTAIIPLTTDNELLDKYVTFLGHVRIGRLMEDVDIFAVWCCVKHLRANSAEDNPFPYIIVTIRVERIDMLKSAFQPTGDIRLSGHVCWVGNSSLEVMVWLDQSEDGEWKRITKALLLLATRNPLNTGPAIANPIKAETPKEEEILRGAENRKQRRMQMRSNMTSKKVPSKEELNLIHSLFLQTMDRTDELLGGRILPPNSKWMPETTVHNLIFCHPEFRNMHNKIFGGFLMRQALELAWLTAYFYGSKLPRLIKISDISFFKPVDVGSVLKLHSSITYTEGEYMQIFVFAEALPTSDTRGSNTTSFNFTFHFGRMCDTIYPLTYLVPIAFTEAMKYIDGRRQFHDQTELPQTDDQILFNPNST